MCTKTPKPKEQKDKPVQYLRNPFLDGLAIGQGRGRDSLRIDPGSRYSAPPGDQGRLVELPGGPPPAPRVDHGLFIPPPKGGAGGRRGTIKNHH